MDTYRVWLEKHGLRQLHQPRRHGSVKGRSSVLTQHLLLPVNPPRKNRSISPPTVLTWAGRKCYTQETWKLKLPTSTVRNYTQSSSSQISINTIHLKKIKNITYFSCSHGADVKEILLSSKNDKVSERQSFPIPIHSRNSYWTFCII